MMRKQVPSPSAFGFIATSRHHGIYRPIDHETRRKFIQVERVRRDTWAVLTATKAGLGLAAERRATYPTLLAALAAAKTLDDQIRNEES